MVPHAHRGTVSSAFTRVNVGSARRLGLAPDGYAHLLGLSPEHLNDDRYRIPAATNIRLWELAALHATWPAASLLMVQQSGLGTLGVWDYLITSAPTPLEGLRDASAYFAALGDASTESLEITDDGDHITLSHRTEADLTYEAASAVRAYALGLYRRRLCDAARRDLVPVRVTLAAEVPRHHHALTELYGTGAIDFEAPVSSITFRAEDLRTPTPHVQPGLSALLRRHAEQTLAAAVPLHDWLALFRTALTAVHDRTTPTLAAVAQQMAVSTRTLQRRLDEHGTTWSEELETVRRDHITRLLRSTDLSIDAIAVRSGYADARALRRAVQRWYGRTPATLRQAADGP